MDCTLSKYTDFLLSVPKYATATAMSAVFDNQLSHDKISRFLRSSYLDSTSVWKSAKEFVRSLIKFEDDSGVISVDDSIVEKAHTDENAMICYHWDHSLQRHVKGINFISLMYSHEKLNIPIQVRVVEKTEPYTDKKTGKTKYKSPKTKNEHFLDMLGHAKKQVGFQYVLGDSWFSSAANINFIINKLDRHAVLAVKTSRTVALSDKDRKNGKFIRVDQVDQLEREKVLKVYLRSVEKAVVLVKQVFTNKDGSQGILYLIATDLSMSYDAITTIYKKRWKVEEYHKSLKQHTALAGSPTKIIATQANHFYAAIIAYIKLEKIKSKTGNGHFRLKAILMLAATKNSMEVIQGWLNS
ncbi:MAG: transposase [Bacteroidota bacterium]